LINISDEIEVPDLNFVVPVPFRIDFLISEVDQPVSYVTILGI
jgi:hypothetical protein